MVFQAFALVVCSCAHSVPACKIVNLAFGGEDVVSLKSVGRVVGTKYLPLLALPLRLIDGINIVLNLHDNAAVLLNSTTTAVKALSRLNRERTLEQISALKIRSVTMNLPF